MSTDISSSSTETYDPTVAAPATGDPRTSASVRNPMQNIVNRIRFAWVRLQELFGSFLPLSTAVPVAASVAGDIITITGHGLSANDPVRLLSVGGSVPAPLVAGTTYYAVTVTSNTFKVSATSGGGAITLTNTGSGAIFVAKRGAASFYQISADGLVTLNGALVQNGAGGIVGNAGLTITGGITQGTGSNTLGGDTLVGGYLSPQKASAPVSQSISATATTATIDASKPVWYVDTPFPGSAPSGTLVVTIDKVTVVPPADAEIMLVCWNLQTHTPLVGVQRNDATVLGSMTTPDKVAHLRFKYVGNVWRIVGFSGSGTAITTG